MKTNTTEFDVQNHVAWITLNRPHVMNALNIELKWQLSQHLDEIERREDIWVAVITGAGERAFSAAICAAVPSALACMAIRMVSASSR